MFLCKIIIYTVAITASMIQIVSAETIITCNGVDTVKQEWTIKYSNESNTVSLIKKNTQEWSEIFGPNVACGIKTVDADCTHTYFDNLNDSSYPNKFATDSINCSNSNGAGISRGEFKAQFYNGSGEFWCNYRAQSPRYKLKLNDCSAEIIP